MLIVVTIQLRDGSMNREDCLKAYELMTIGMIEKDPDKLRESMSKDACLIHMTGKAETREEYIKDILDETLNYYDYEIISFSETDATIKLLAKVYGGAKSWWTLHMLTEYIIEDNKVKVKECKVRMA